MADEGLVVIDEFFHNVDGALLFACCKTKIVFFLYGMELRRVKKCLFAVCCNAVACVNGRQLHATVVAVILFFRLKVLEVIFFLAVMYRLQYR